MASLAVFPLQAQEALRPSLAGARAAQARRLALENQAYNATLGPIDLLLSASLVLELNDNVNLAEEGQQEDLILRPELSLYANWPVTERNALKLSTGIGYAKYLDNPQYDRLIVRPGSELSFGIYAGDFKINLHERFSYTHDPINQGSVSGEAEFGGFYNTAGLDVNWDLNEVILSLGYDHYNFLSSVERFDYLDRGSDSMVARVSFLPNAAIRWGFEVAGGINDYRQNVLNDTWTASAGVFAEWTVTSKIRLTPRAGYVQYDFDDGGLVGDTPDRQTYYFALQGSHAVNEAVSQSLEAGRSVDLGISSDLLELWYVRHSLALRIIRKVGLQTHLFYEQGRENGALLAESYDRIGGGVGLSYQLMQKLHTRVGYGLTVKNSDVALRDYLQNRVTLEFTYRF